MPCPHVLQLDKIVQDIKGVEANVSDSTQIADLTLEIKILVEL
jgi:hypothetical protein